MVEKAITGATGASYTPSAADLGYKLRVVITGAGGFYGVVGATTANVTVEGSLDPLRRIFKRWTPLAIYALDVPAYPLNITVGNG